jgi:hypothetical protein
LFVSLAALTFAASAVSASPADRASMLRQLDQVCTWTGLRRVGDLRQVKYWQQDRDAGCKAKVFLVLEGRRIDYSVEFRRERGELKFWALSLPDSAWAAKRSDWRDFTGLGADTLKDPRARDFALAAVNKLNKNLRWHWFGQPRMQKVGSHIIITFETISREQRNEPGWYLRYVDPFDTFIVSPKGTVISAERTSGNDS